MSACVTTMPTLLAKNWLMSNVANAMTGFMAGSRVIWNITAQLPSHSTTHGDITPMEIMVIFQENDGTYAWINAYSTIFATFLHQIAPLRCTFLQSFAESANMLAKSWMMSCWHFVWQVGMTFFSQCWAKIFDILPACQHVSGWHVI